MGSQKDQDESAVKNDQVLPMLAPARGVSGKNWAEGLEEGPREEGHSSRRRQATHAVAEAEQWVECGAPAGPSFGQWLRALLDDGSDNPYILHGLGHALGKSHMFVMAEQTWSGEGT